MRHESKFIVSRVWGAWRPIRLLVRGPQSDSVTVTIEFVGLDADSAKVYDSIQNHLRKTHEQSRVLA